MKNHTAERWQTSKNAEERVLSLSEFRNQYMKRVLTLVDMDLNQAANLLHVPEHDVAFCLERA
ncbi:MAG: hypothetical protein SGI88_17595 [Candidatus Hydrogenedentes bacterium]|nr:hypothetical protein [Candidatus Hydrogenedentota bacterium]